MRVVVVGLGCAGPEQLTLEARQVLAAAGDVWVRTRRHPALATLPATVNVHSLEQALARGQRAEEAARLLLRRGRRYSELVYATPGNPLAGDAIAACLKAQCQEIGVPFRAVAGVGLVEATTWLPSCVSPLVTQDCLSVSLDPGRPALVCHLQPGLLAGLKDRLLRSYPPEHRAKLVSLGEGQAKVLDSTLSGLERLPRGSYVHCLYVPPRDGASFESLVNIIVRLRGPGGCPWDREQTHISLKPYLLEEAYEALEALDEEDPVKLKEELGDVLLQILLHSQMAREEGTFQIGDVVSGLAQKLVRRHPHVFGTAEAKDAQQVIARWEELKREERGEQASILEGVPKGMPSLVTSQTMQRRVSRVGFEWRDRDELLEKLREEVEEVWAATDPEQRLVEFGDVLFVLADAARWLGVDGDEALRQANQRFRQRFQYMEESCRRRGVALDSLSPEDWRRLWQEAKVSEGKGG